MIEPHGGPALRPGSLGVMADLHANPWAVEAVVADAERFGVERWLVLGDVVAMGPEPVAVLDILDRLDVVATISGNTERYVLAGDRPYPDLSDVELDPSLLPRLVEVAAAFGWTKGFLAAADRLATIAAYAPAVELTLPDGTALLAVHASLAADDGQGISPDPDDDVLADLFSGATAPLVVGGHTHHPTDRNVDGVRMLNPGSVSNPPSDDRDARYLLLHCTDAGHTVELRSVPYDVDAVRRSIEGSGYPGADYLLTRHFA